MINSITAINKMFEDTMSHFNWDDKGIGDNYEVDTMELFKKRDEEGTNGI